MPFGQYLLLKRLAVGGMAELYLAKDTRADRLVVIKRILPYLAQEPEFVQMFLDEARIAAQLHHPNIITVYELGSLEGSIFIAMEFVEGVDLRMILQKEQSRQRAVPPNIAAWLTARLCEGLHYAHHRVGGDGRPLGIIHRDVSPQNLMVGYGGEVKLVDFGIAKASAFMERSKPGVIKGKFLYLSPEQLSQDRTDHRADLFALGTMLYEICVGRSPFFRPTTEAVIYAIRAEDPPPPHVARGRFPERLSRIIMRCLIKDRGRRFQQAGEVHAELEAWLEAEAPTTAEDVKRYVATLFGTDDERTVLFIPPNAQGPNDRSTGSSPQPSSAAVTNPAGRRQVQLEPTDPDRTAGGMPSSLPRGETTRPLVSPVGHEPETTVSISSPVGRRPTPGSLRAASPPPSTVRLTPALPTQARTRTARPDDLPRLSGGVGREPAGSDPGEATVPIVSTPLAGPSIRRSGSSPSPEASMGELDQTASSQSGANAPRTDDSLPALTASRLGTGLGGPGARRGQVRTETAAVFEVPERYARDEIPQRSPPVRPTRAAPPSRPRPLYPSEDDLGPLLDSAIPSAPHHRPEATDDEDDAASTIDLRGAGSLSAAGARLAQRPWLVMLLVFGVVLTLGLIMLGMMRSGRPVAVKPGPRGAESRGSTDHPELNPDGAANAEPTAATQAADLELPSQIEAVHTVVVRFRAQPGTRVVHDGISLTLNTAYRWKPGTYQVQFRCPRRGRATMPDITRTIELSGREPEVTIDLCR